MGVERTMRIKGDFMIREITGEDILIVIGQVSQNFNRMIKLN